MLGFGNECTEGDDLGVFLGEEGLKLGFAFEEGRFACEEVTLFGDDRRFVSFHGG